MERGPPLGLDRELSKVRILDLLFLTNLQHFLLAFLDYSLIERFALVGVVLREMQAKQFSWLIVLHQ